MSTPDTTLDIYFKLKKEQKAALQKLGLLTIQDLLYHIPLKYSEAASISTIAQSKENELVTLTGIVKKIETKRSFKSKVPMTEATIGDSTSFIKVLWFHQPYIGKTIKEGTTLKVTGSVTEKNGKRVIINPDYEVIQSIPEKAPHSLFTESEEDVSAISIPTYPESKGISSKWFFHSIGKIIAEGIHEKVTDPIPHDVLKKYNLPTLHDAFILLHRPRKEKDSLVARKRFAFEEVFLIQIERMQTKKELSKEPAFLIPKDEKQLQQFIQTFPFSLTGGQKRAIQEITNDFTEGHPMARLLEGDVGSGKTAVAVATSHAIVTTPPKGREYGHLQVAYMAPTEILATQHFYSFIEYFKDLPISIGLITSNGCKKFPSKVKTEEATSISRSQLLKWAKEGSVSILIGTHSLIQKSVEFAHLAYVIIDEQHRFGTEQRKKMMAKEKRVPHFLSMSATPIPRTLALTIYGDLDLSLLEEMPKGRKPVITEIITEDKREAMYEKVRIEIENGRQAFVICPRIDEPDQNKLQVLLAKSVKAEAARLKKDVFKNQKIAILHSKLNPKEKEDTMEKFARGEFDILVSTSVIEVGVSIPNATVILIEGAERFGLAQLHQLRGRVIRGTHQAYCFALTDSTTEKTISRLKAFVTAPNGFVLAEKDLELRGAGDLYGRKQWGISDIGMEALKNIKMVEAARTEAARLVEEGFEIEKRSKSLAGF